MVGGSVGILHRNAVYYLCITCEAVPVQERCRNIEFHCSKRFGGPVAVAVREEFAVDCGFRLYYAAAGTVYTSRDEIQGQSEENSTRLKGSMAKTDRRQGAFLRKTETHNARD